jgi:DNA-binding transcriptional MerR regulator
MVRVRIKELADLTGSTVRTIRYYHQIGLLPIPARRDGVRDYDMIHVARIVRVRWLSQAGIPLATVATMLAEEAATGTGARPAPAPGPPDGAADPDRSEEVPAGRESVLADLNAGLATVDEQLAALRAQRDRITALIAAVERGGRLSPMPAVVFRFYEQMERHATDETTRRAIRHERDFVELAYYRGDMPAESAILFEGLTDRGLDEGVAQFRAIAERDEQSHLLDEHEVSRIADAAVDRFTRRLGPDLPRILGRVDLGIARRAADLYLRLADPRQRRLGRAIADAMLTAIEKGRVP